MPSDRSRRTSGFPVSQDEPRGAEPIFAALDAHHAKATEAEAFLVRLRRHVLLHQSHRARSLLAEVVAGRLRVVAHVARHVPLRRLVPVKEPEVADGMPHRAVGKDKLAVRLRVELLLDPVQHPLDGQHVLRVLRRVAASFAPLFGKSGYAISAFSSPCGKSTTSAGVPGGARYVGSSASSITSSTYAHIRPRNSWYARRSAGALVAMCWKRRLVEEAVRVAAIHVPVLSAHVAPRDTLLGAM